MILGLVGLTALAVLGVSHPADAVSCGPGLHWVDTCPSGTDKFLSQSEHGVVIFDPEDGGFVIPLPLMTGFTEVFRGAGTVSGTDHFIVTEMVRLFLSGGGLTLRAGDGTGNLASDGPLFSPGRITELSNPPNGVFAHSFFDIFFEISDTPFGPLHNITACRMTADIDRVPPSVGTTYTGCHDPLLSTNTTDGPLLEFLDLFDAGGEHRARLTEAVFHIVGVAIPEPSTLLLVGVGLAGLTGIAWRRHRRR